MNNWEAFKSKYGNPIGKGAQCQVYRKGDKVYKVLSVGHNLASAFHEGFALAAAENAGVLVSNIHGVYTENGHIVMEMDYVSGDSFMDLILLANENKDAAAIDAYLDEFVALQIQLHNKVVPGLGDVRHSFKSLFETLEIIPHDIAFKLLQLLDTLPDGNALCHNDFHPLNVIRSGDQNIVIDWDSAMIGDPSGDVAHTFLVCVLADEAFSSVYSNYSEKYLEKYLASSHIERNQIEAWIPIHATILYFSLISSDPENAQKIKPFLHPLM